MTIPIDVFRDMLPINKHRLDEELETHAVSADRIASLTAAANKRMLSAKREVDALTAAIAADLREGKVPATLVEKEAKRDPRYRAAYEEFLDLQEEYEQWQGLNSAWTSRGYNLKPLGELFAHGYFAMTSIVSEDAGKAQQRRREMAAGLASQREGAPRRRVST